MPPFWGRKRDKPGSHPLPLETSESATGRGMQFDISEINFIVWKYMRVWITTLYTSMLYEAFQRFRKNMLACNLGWDSARLDHVGKCVSPNILPSRISAKISWRDALLCISHAISKMKYIFLYLHFTFIFNSLYKIVVNYQRCLQLN